MKNIDYIIDFEKMAFGMFVHFGLFSIVGKGEWAEHICKIPQERYEQNANKFNPRKDWAKRIVKTAKSAGCKYIILTTRHHDGFSLFDTQGLSDFDVMNSKCKRDLVKEFVTECNAQGIKPFLYHTLLDWHNPDYKNDFDKYLDFLHDSVKLLCTNYGQIGGFWFDGWWEKKSADWKFDRLYATIRKYQPKAMIINNTGLHLQGVVGHYEIDSVTYERGTARKVEYTDRYRAGEMCQVLNEHWGYAINDCNYKSVAQLISDLIDCRSSNCNFLLNVGPKPNGQLKMIDKALFMEIGKWVKANKNFIYDVKLSDVTADGAIVLTDGKDHYLVAKDVPMVAEPDVALTPETRRYVKINAQVKSVTWLDNNKKTKCVKNVVEIVPFEYGNSLAHRVGKLNFKN